MKIKAATVESHAAIRALIVGIGSGALLFLTAPYETSALFSMWERLTFWVLSSVFAAYLLTAIEAISHELAWDQRAPRSIAFWGAILAAAVPVTLFVQLIGPAINNEVQLLPFWQLFPSVLILCAPMQVVLKQMARPEVRRKSLPVAITQPDSRSPLLEKLPAALGRDILCMKMEDHYLRVFTSKGEALILMRMSDAEASLNKSSGQRVHRSWWVAQSAVQHVRTIDNGCWLVLTNGLEVPVSRSRRELLRDKGWFR